VAVGAAWALSADDAKWQQVFNLLNPGCCAAPLGAAHALSLDVRRGPPGLDSLHVRCASPSWLRLLP